MFITTRLLVSHKLVVHTYNRSRIAIDKECDGIAMPAGFQFQKYNHSMSCWRNQWASPPPKRMQEHINGLPCAIHPAMPCPLRRSHLGNDSSLPRVTEESKHWTLPHFLLQLRWPMWVGRLILVKLYPMLRTALLDIGLYRHIIAFSGHLKGMTVKLID